MAAHSDRAGRTAIARNRQRAEGQNFAAGLLITYLVIAYGVHHLYPFYVFDMYNQPPPRSSSRIIARSADGEVHDVTDFIRWACPSSVLRPIETCEGCDGSDARDDDALAYIDGQPLAGQAGEPIDVVRRVYTFGTGEGDTTVRDYLITHCLAVPR